LSKLTFSTRTISVDQFVPRAEIDDLYIDQPYYIVPIVSRHSASSATRSTEGH